MNAASEQDAERRRRLERALVAARIRYAATLPARADEMRRLWQACVTPPGDRAAAEELHALAHRLAGTAGSFGFHTVSAASARVDAVLAAALQESRPLAGVAAAVAPEVEAVVAACHAAPRSQPR